MAATSVFEKERPLSRMHARHRRSQAALPIRVFEGFAPVTHHRNAGAMRSAQIGDRLAFERIEEQRCEVDAGGRRECERPRETRIHFDDRETAVGAQHALHVRRPGDPGLRNDVAGDRFDARVTVSAAFHRDAGFDRDALARHGRNDAARLRREAVDGEFRSVDGLLHDEAFAPTRRVGSDLDARDALRADRARTRRGFR